MDFVSWDNYPANEDSYAKIATASNEAFYQEFLKDICEEKGVLPAGNLLMRVKDVRLLVCKKEA